MTQDQSGQAQGTGYVVRGEVVPDDETDERYADDAGPMTRLRKVASALRGDKPDETVPDETAAPNADTTDPNGSWSSRPGEPSTVSSLAVEDEADYADATDPDDVAAVRVPEAGDRDYWDNDADKTTAPGGDVTVDETTVPAGDVAADETMPPVGGVTVPGGGIAETVPDTGIDSGAPSYASQPATEYGRYGSQAGIATDPVVTGPNGAGPSGADVGTAGPGTVGPGDDRVRGDAGLAAVPAVLGRRLAGVARGPGVDSRVRDRLRYPSARHRDTPDRGHRLVRGYIPGRDRRLVHGYIPARGGRLVRVVVPVVAVTSLGDSHRGHVIRIGCVRVIRFVLDGQAAHRARLARAARP